MFFNNDCLLFLIFVIIIFLVPVLYGLQTAGSEGIRHIQGGMAIDIPCKCYMHFSFLPLFFLLFFLLILFSITLDDNAV